MNKSLNEVHSDCVLKWPIHSGDLREPQPKAAGSSILYALTNELALDLIRQNGVRRCKDCFVAPVATGMAMALCLLAIRSVSISFMNNADFSRIFPIIICLLCQTSSFFIN